METVAHAARRKACDYCVSRKIKCDGRKPTCSNCTLYGVACKITAVSRRRAAARYNESAPSPASPSRTDALEERLANIEALLTMLTGTSSSASPPTPQPVAQYPEISLDDLGLSIPSGDWSIRTHRGMVNNSTSTYPEPLSSTVSATTSDHLELAPLTEIMPVVDNYFRNYNRVIPLFDEAAFMRMLLDCYSHSNNRTLVSWAAINVVLALSYRILEGRSMDDPALAQALRNVHSVMAQLMTHNTDLTGLQVLLGTVILYQGSADFQLAIVLIGSVMRLAQSMRLQSKQALAGLSKADALARCHVFWIAYMFERELSLRARAPYHQPDGETDLDLPAANPEDDLGVIRSTADTAQLCYLRARAQLACIQGRVHDVLYSQRTKTLTQEQKSTAVSRIEMELEEWRREIPAELQDTDKMRQRLSPVAVQLMMTMLYRHFECLVQIRSIFSFDDAWIDRVNRYLSPAVIEINDDEQDGEVRRSSLTPLPRGWSECVERSRLCVELLTMKQQTEHTLWLQICGSYSCLILLIVNMIEFPDHSLVETDRKLIDKCQAVFEHMGYISLFGTLINVARELDRRARGQVKRVSRIKDGTLYREEIVELSPSAAWSILDDMEL
ncbi:hypothetical protein FZEAL_3507 [Fusarium zealandicum]|uniref:Zn(2)-C6 fungal-type domain-containing protein n=1 Tax=Fusarium zealandicum TaxID=1053134 RepID=A0A8H4XMD6_9HYPO|nr:hypothetical protein FZEAL_3507 [Fusarium zealandicum]